jgi:hypothetical protein
MTGGRKADFSAVPLDVFHKKMIGCLDLTFTVEEART